MQPRELIDFLGVIENLNAIRDIAGRPAAGTKA